MTKRCDLFSSSKTNGQREERRLARRIGYQDNQRIRILVEMIEGEWLDSEDADERVEGEAHRCQRRSRQITVLVL